MSADPVDPSKKHFIVSIYEVKQEIVFAEEFNGCYTKSVAMSDGTTRNVELTPMMRNGQLVVEFKDNGGRTYIGTVRVGTGTTINGNLMVSVADVDDLEAARAEWRKGLPEYPVLPPNTSLLSIAAFVPAGFTQGIEILNDNTTTMKFVQDALTNHAGLGPEEAQQAMLAVHSRGGVLIPTDSLADAGRIAALIAAEAAAQAYPLVCRAVSVSS